ncbi:oligoendopeptidase, pepF/M3 family [Lentibacillus halodurans]|uniref:Oligoendopeptidase, pepF/M3 family n=1 Tax=Lentibacillus halodurans TaxID=237679 RepID=A0A1I1AAI4_9BACI|nr:M3 family oligoendopeptidase [Lentibacillus halodurans]SFB34995.1 oligoendopeptidase, pepF/M3 family [Lentibacillus halodurans]
MRETMLNPKWDLDSIFPGGSTSETFHTYLENVQENIQNVGSEVDQFNPNDEDADAGVLANIATCLEDAQNKMKEAFAFISCLNAEDMNDKKTDILVARRNELRAEMGAVRTKLNQKLTEINDIAWNELLDKPELKQLRFVLNEKRKKAKELLSPEQEVLINDLEVDGYDAWNQMYNTIIGNMRVEVEEDGEVNSYSVGQASNKLTSPDRSIRKQVFKQLNKEWTRNSDFFGQTLNHLAGFRLQKYKHRNWHHVLKEPLAINRMKQETLDAMWTAINRNKQHFVAFLQKKADLLGQEKLSIYDVNAPISKSVKTSTYTEGAHFIVENFRQFSPKMANFAQMAFENRWIEAEDRPGKRPGGFCTSFPDSKQTRIFMTYSGTSANIATLAHELGHAYHQHVMNDIHGLNQGYAMNVAETASTFAEMIVADASVKRAQTSEEKVALLEDKIKRSIAFFMNIHARFLFERRFYEERQQGMVSVERLNELMIDAQKEAYCEMLDEYDPNFWASKLHFHITGVPFYNFPYTFGYLFSLGIYKYAQEIGSDFEDDYIALLRDTGRMTVEELAEKHLNVDLTKPDFWENAIKLCVEDVETFLSLTTA